MHSLRKVVIEGPEINIIEKIKKAKGKDEEIVRVIEKMKKVEIRTLKGKEWQLEGDLILKERKVYVPKDEELRVEIIQLHHDVPVARHGGKWKTTELVMRNYWWPGVTKDMMRYVEGFDMYQRMKNRMEALVGKLKLSEVLEKLWTYLIVDCIIKLLLVARKDAILVVCDRLSKMTYFVAMTEGTSVKELARLFRDNIWKLHELPESIVSDRGPQFAAELTKKMNKILGIETKLSTAFHSQTQRYIYKRVMVHA